MSDVLVSLDADEAITKTSKDYNAAMIRFQRWVSENPGKSDSFDEEFLLLKQEIKLLRVRLNELREMKDNYQNTLLMAPRYNENFIVNNEIIKSRDNVVSTGERGSKLGNRNINKLSVG